MKGNLSHKIYPFPHLLPQTIETKRKPNNLWVFARENKVVFANRMRKKHHFSCLFILPLFESFRDIATDWTIASYLTSRRSITRQKTNFSNNEIIRQGNHYKQNREKRNVATLKVWSNTWYRLVTFSSNFTSLAVSLLLSGWLRDLFRRVSWILFFSFHKDFHGIAILFLKVSICLIATKSSLDSRSRCLPITKKSACLVFSEGLAFTLHPYKR